MNEVTLLADAIWTGEKLSLSIPETPDLTVRRFRAKEVVDEYGWEINLFGVRFKKGKAIISTVLNDQQVGCTCPDCKHRKALCKHIFAAAYLLGDKDAIVEKSPTPSLLVAATDEAGIRERKWRSDNRPQNVRVGKYFMLSDFLYSERAVQKGIPNCPEDLFDGCEVYSLRQLCAAILDPLVDQFGPTSITYGYLSPELHANLYGPKDSLGLHSCVPVGGKAKYAAAADVLVHAKKDEPRDVLNWIRDNCIYDRLILYPGSSIVCTAWQDKPRFHCKEWVFPDTSQFSKAIYIDARRSL